MLVLLGVVTGAVGLLFGSTQTSLAAFFTLRDEQAVTGLVYGTMAVGSATMGLLTNRLPARFSFSWRIVLFGLGSAVVSPLLVFAWDAPAWRSPASWSGSWSGRFWSRRTRWPNGFRRPSGCRP